MAKQPLVIVENHGGKAADDKQGVRNSFAYSRHIDFRKKPTSMTILPETVKETSTTVTELITDMIQLPSGKMVAIGDSGGVYVRTTAGSWSKDGTTLTDTAAGMVYNLQHDTIYIPGQTAVHTITNADGRFSGGTFTVNDSSFTAQVDQSATTSTSTYTTTNAINEGATHKLSITPTIEPLYSVKLWVTAKGSDDITVTMHDEANNVLGAVTKTAASLTNGALNEFVFTNVRMSTKPTAATYHFHVTHATSSSTTIGTGTASDLSDARFESLSNRLVQPNNGLHPAYEFLQYILILNERYLAVWEPISQTNPTELEFLQHRLTFPSGYEGTSGAIWTEYFAIGAEKRSTSATNEFQQGKIFFWDGISTTYNFVLDIPEGAPYGLYSHKGVLYYMAGGAWYAWSGGQPVKLFQMPNTDFEFTDSETYMLNLPHTMAVRNNILLAGFPSETNSTNIEHGVYSFGSRDKNYNESFGYSYTISSGTITNGTLRIGIVKSFGDKLFISWRDSSTYGVDIVDTNSDPFGTATYESLIIDNGRPNKDKQATVYKIGFKSLPTGATVTPKYKIDRANSWTSGTTVTSGTEAKLNINKRYKEIQVGFDLVATDTTPEITSQELIWDTLAKESD